MKENKTNRWFTLVELIVVITILAILWTIAFISLQWYSKDARDSVRMTDLSNIEKQLELYIVKWTKLPIPDESITLESLWTVIWYQWSFSEEILNKIWVNGWWKDPLDDTYYTYRINANKTAYQIMWYLENGTEISSLNLLNQTNAIDYTKRYPKIYWNVLWILIDNTTNKPLDKIKTWTFELQWDATNIDIDIDLYFLTDSRIIWTPQTLYWILETIASNQNFSLPLTCPTWFISVPWSRELWQPSFCVAKYEMTYTDADTPSSIWWWTDWNTVSYTWAKIPVSMAWKYPIADITQQQAIDSCKSMWEWYHLITNNEWTAIARNIEIQPINWSGWIVWENFIYNWVSNWTSWCLGVTNTIYTSLTRNWATKTGGWFWNVDCDNKRKLTLSNSEEIWDLSWNVWEHVNKANTIDWTDYATWTNPDILTTNNAWWEWSSASSNYKELYWPSVWVDASNWIWRIYQADWTVFVRGGGASDASYTGVFTLYLDGASTSQSRNAGFRCSL